MKINHYFKLLFLILLLNTILVQGQELKKYWVYFKDKGNDIRNTTVLQKASSEYQTALTQLSDRAIIRRSKVLAPERLIDAQDLPIHPNYINTIRDIGGLLQKEVRWMNAASFKLTDEDVMAVKQLPFVDIIKPVEKFIRKNLPASTANELQKLQSTTSYDYGLSQQQYAAVKIPEVHDLGIAGEGVLVGMLDTGFRWRVHESLQSTKVIAEHDFINNDDTTANQAGDPNGQDSHGTLTMSILGSNLPGKIIGPAFKSDFILGKTEYVPTETQIEEDWWAAGIEWMESQGVDVVSSSLGYSTFDDGGGYYWDNGDFNGRTSITSKAAARAARLGVVVVTAMGNEGNGDGVRGTLLCPADADSILSVGAITINGSLAYFSSTGPTNDGRIKPDVVTPGVSIYSAQIPGPSTYGYSQGTSASTPITAGIAALVLSARPELTPLQVRDAIRNTAERVEVSRFPNHPNNFVGWGNANALLAISYFGPVFSGKPNIYRLPDSTYQIQVNVLSQYGIQPQGVLCNYTADNSVRPSLTMYLEKALFFPTSGLYTVTIPHYPPNTKIRFKISANDSSDNSYSTPSPFIGEFWEFNYGDTSIQPIVSQFALSQNYPNPFKYRTTIIFNSPVQTYGEINIYNVLGQKIKTIHEGTIDKGVNEFFWYGINDQGLKVTSGVYFYLVRTKEYSADRKMLLLR